MTTYIQDCLAHKKRVSKSTAWEYLQAIANSTPSEHPNYDLLTELGTYFMPKTSPATLLKQAASAYTSWVKLSVAVKSPRYSLNYVYSDEDNLVATDGKLLHMVAAPLSTKGLHDPATLARMPEADQHAYPDYRKVLPSLEDALAHGLVSEATVYYYDRLVRGGAATTLTLQGHSLTVPTVQWEQALCGIATPTLRLYDTKLMLTGFTMDGGHAAKAVIMAFI